jgi:probable phosphoglycerate mutase
VFAADGDVLVFAHGHVLRVLAACWLEQPPAFGQRLGLDPATISVLGWEHDRACVRTWNAPVAG